MRVDTRSSLSVPLKIPIHVLVSTLANLLIRDLRFRGDKSVEEVLKSSVFAYRLRNSPRQSLVEIATRLGNPQPTDYWPTVEYALTLLLLEFARAFGISAPEEDVSQIDREYLVEWSKWVHVWSSAK